MEEYYIVKYIFDNTEQEGYFERTDSTGQILGKYRARPAEVPIFFEITNQEGKIGSSIIGDNTTAEQIFAYYIYKGNIIDNRLQENFGKLFTQKYKALFQYYEIRKIEKVCLVRFTDNRGTEQFIDEQQAGDIINLLITETNCKVRVEYKSIEKNIREPDDFVKQEISKILGEQSITPRSFIDKINESYKEGLITEELTKQLIEDNEEETDSGTATPTQMEEDKDNYQHNEETT